MEKLSERVHTLVPKQSDKLKADLVDIVIYLITCLPILHMYTPLYGADDYSWYKAVILGSLLFILLNYFIRYFIPLKFKGKTIGKMIFNIKTVDYYGYEAKSGQLLLKESFYIFFPILSFSKFTDINYILMGIWLLVFVKSIGNAYLLNGVSNRQKRNEAVKLLKRNDVEITEELAEASGLNIVNKTSTLYKVYKIESRELKAIHKETITDLEKKHKDTLSTIPKEDKDTRYNSELKHKQEKELIINDYNKKQETLSTTYYKNLNELEKTELAKLEETISGFYEEDQVRSLPFIQKQALQIQGRSVMDLRANTIVVDSEKFDRFFEAHRTEE